MMHQFKTGLAACQPAVGRLMVLVIGEICKGGPRSPCREAIRSQNTCNFIPVNAAKCTF